MLESDRQAKVLSLRCVTWNCKAWSRQESDRDWPSSPGNSQVQSMSRDLSEVGRSEKKAGKEMLRS